MPQILPRLAPTALVLALAAASTPLAAQTATDGAQRITPSTTRLASTTRIPPPTGTTRQGILLHTMEDQPLALDAGFGALSGKVVVPPKHGTLLDDRAPMVYVPHPDFHGEEFFVLAAGPEKFEVAVKVVAVNDPPRFIAGPGATHRATGRRVHVVPGWATDISPGPGAEALTQTLWFHAEAVDDPDGVLAWMEVDKTGTLSYELTGRAGVARWALRAHDDGGDEYGGSAVSAPQEVSIGVDMVADLAIKLVAQGLPADLGQPRPYQLVVSNHGKSPVQGARVVDVLPKDSGQPTWRCTAYGGASCPKAEVSEGAVNAEVDLPNGGMVVFSVDGVVPMPGSDWHSAFVAPPAHVEDPDLGNNEARE